MINLKSATVIHDHMYIYPLDPALARPVEGECEDYDAAMKAWETEFDAAIEANDSKRLPLLPNEKPTIFWLRHPGPQLKRWIEDLCHDKIELKAGKIRMTQERSVARKVAALCIARAENLGMELELNGYTDPKSDYPAVSPASMDILERAPGLIDGICARVIAQLNPAPS